jgi:hypothetical protein
MIRVIRARIPHAINPDHQNTPAPTPAPRETRTPAHAKTPGVGGKYAGGGNEASERTVIAMFTRRARYVAIAAAAALAGVGVALALPASPGKAAKPKAAVAYCGLVACWPVTVTYSAVQHWPDGFQGELTIVNHGRSAVNGWQLVIALPGDQVRAVWNAEWHQGGGGVRMTAASQDELIEPGASQAVNFVAKGHTTNPVNCTFDGSACR